MSILISIPFIIWLIGALLVFQYVDCHGPIYDYWKYNIPCYLLKVGIFLVVMALNPGLTILIMMLIMGYI